MLFRMNYTFCDTTGQISSGGNHCQYYNQQIMQLYKLIVPRFFKPSAEYISLHQYVLPHYEWAETNNELVM